MKHPDAALLDEVRALGCLSCPRPPRSEAAHIFGKGSGNSSRLDVRTNVAPLCLYCHRRSHQGGEPTAATLIVRLAASLLLDPAAMEARLYRMKWAPKECQVCPRCEGTGVDRLYRDGSWVRVYGRPKVILRELPCGLCAATGILDALGDPWHGRR